jgi:hypothetical protein
MEKAQDACVLHTRGNETLLFDILRGISDARKMQRQDDRTV